MSNDSAHADSQPVVLGGEPLFSKKLPIVKPALPEFDSLKESIAEIMASGMLTKGQHLRSFEEEVAAHLGVEHAVGLSSCTSGLMLTYQALGLEGEVVVPSFTFMATVSSLIWAGLRPVFADVDPRTTNLDPAAAEKAITPRTSALVAVHNFGNPADIDALEAVATRHGLKLIFDAAHGFGSRYQGETIGRQGCAQVYSLSPTKLLIAGEGGVVATDDGDLAEQLRRGREYGMGEAYDSLFAGLNARMSEMHALVARHSLRLLDREIQRRQEIAAIYREEMSSIPGVEIQYVRPQDRCSYKDFAIFIDGEAFGLTRDDLATALLAENIDTRSYYHPPVHHQTAYRHLAASDAELVNTERLSARVLCLPIWSAMDDATVRKTCLAVRRLHESADEVGLALEPASKPRRREAATSKK